MTKYNTISSGILDSSNLYNGNVVDTYDMNTHTAPVRDIVQDYDQIKQELAEIKKMLMMLNRDNVMEEKYPKLKEAADEYHKQLHKYQTFEILKGKSS